MHKCQTTFGKLLKPLSRGRGKSSTGIRCNCRRCNCRCCRNCPCRCLRVAPAWLFSPVAALTRLKGETIGKLQALEIGAFSLRARGATKTCTGWHAGIIECLLGAVPEAHMGFLLSEPEACQTSPLALQRAPLPVLGVSLSGILSEDGRHQAKTPRRWQRLENSYLPTHQLIHIHIPVCSQTLALSRKDIPRQDVFAHSYGELLKRCQCTAKHILMNISQ